MKIIETYGIIGTVRLVISFLYTKLFYRNARLIRLPFDIRNRKFIKIGDNFTTGFSCRIEAFPQKTKRDAVIIFGNNIEINDYVHIAAGEKIIIGNNVLIASKVFISDINHGNYKGENQDSPFTFPQLRKLSTSPIEIKNNVWIGEGVCILPGVTVGIGSIIGALSLVTKDIPDYSIAVGSPAKVVKKFDFDKEIWVTIK